MWGVLGREAHGTRARRTRTQKHEVNNRTSALRACVRYKARKAYSLKRRDINSSRPRIHREAIFFFFFFFFSLGNQKIICLSKTFSRNRNRNPLFSLFPAGCWCTCWLLVGRRHESNMRRKHETSLGRRRSRRPSGGRGSRDRQYFNWALSN